MDAMDAMVDKTNALSNVILDAAIKVHKALGPGMFENAYELCLHHELGLRGVQSFRQVILPIRYEGIEIEAGYRIDLLVENLIIVELKAVDQLHKIHEVQLLSYLRFSGLKLGLLINFGQPKLMSGVSRVVNGL